MKIYIGADHRGYTMKNELADWLLSVGHEVIDCGNSQLDPQDDYVDYAFAVAKRVVAGIQANPDSDVRGIGVCGSGIGVSIAANRIKGVRCGIAYDITQTQHARRNDHINMLSIPSDHLTIEEAKTAVSVFLETEESTEEKYIRRERKLDV